MEGREVSVTLTWYEARLAAGVGLERQVAAMRDGRPDKHGFSGSGWEVHLHGAGAEMAFAKASGKYWDGSVDVFRVPDVGDIHVRSRSGDGPREDLIIRSEDDPDAPYVLVVGRMPQYVVVGWLMGRDARRQEWVKDYGGRPPAWFVPRAEMLSFPITAWRGGAGHGEAGQGSFDANAL